MNHRMMPKTLFTVVMLVAVVVSLTGASADRSQLRTTPVYDEDAEFVPGELIVGLEGSGSAQVLATQVQGQVVASIDPLNAYLIKLPDGAQVEQAVATLQASGDVAWAEPNYIGHILTEPGDSPFLSLISPSVGPLEANNLSNSKALSTLSNFA